MNGVEQGFSVVDYIVFGCMLLLSAGIGLFYAVKDRKLQNTEEYLLAGRSMSPYPVAFSLCVSFLSAITVLGTPSEVYQYGTMYIWVLFGCAVAFFITAQVYVPIYYRCRLSSVNQYLERRFHRGIRIFATVIYLFQTILYIGVVIYAPALTLNAVTGVSLWGAALLTGCICIFYSSLGGLKAVLWTDTLQMLFMLVGFLSVIIKASIDSGGFMALWNKAAEGERIQLLKFDLDPRLRHTVWTVAIGSSFLNLAVNAVNPSQVQRYLSCRSLKSAKLAILLNYFGTFLLLSLAVLTGVIMYGYYHNNDPVQLGKVAKAAQLMPYMVLELYQNTPGMLGLFVAAVYSGSLSTVSTAVTAMANVTIYDLLKPFSSFSEATYTWISRGLIVLFGILCLSAAYLTSQLGTLLQVAISVLSLASAPLLVVFTLGILCNFANKWGALAGMLGASFGTVWIFCGKIVYPDSKEFKQALLLFVTKEVYSGDSVLEVSSATSLESALTNVTLATTSTTPSAPPVADLYAMSYMYMTAFGFLIGIIIGIVISLFTGGWQSRFLVNPQLLSSCFQCGKTVRGRKSPQNQYIDTDEESKTKLMKETNFSSNHIQI